MPPDLKARVKAAAEANNRSMNAEIVATLEEKYPAPKRAPGTDEERLLFIRDMIEEIDDDDSKTPAERRAHLSALCALLHEVSNKLDPEVVDRVLDGWIQPKEFGDDKFVTQALYSLAIRMDEMEARESAAHSDDD